jgi:decaprenylphospho-beta-D-erythro-pentofuranosid-2-ulose 2-reductase
MKPHNILIVGATSAIASACARRWAGPGACFFLVGRSALRLEQVGADLGGRGATVHTHVLDLNHFDQHAPMLEACRRALGGIDIALIAHGTRPDQPACEQEVQLALLAFHSNALSVIALLTALAAHMQARPGGCLAVISSVAGDRGRGSNYVYGAAKGAVSVFCSGLRARLAPAGVHVLTIKPGFVDSPMTQGLALPPLLLATPAQVAADIERAIAQRRNTLYTPWFWRAIMVAIALIPERLFKHLRL